MLDFDGNKLKKLRREKNLTQTQLAQLVGKKVGHISNYENGHACPPADILLSLMEFFKARPNEIGVAAEAESK